MDIDKLKRYTLDYSKSDYGRWLRDFEYTKVTIKELPFYKEGLVTALYLSIPNTILIADDNSFTILFAIYIHEMRHAWQRHTMGLLKYMLKKVFNRSALENDAETAEIDAVNWASNVR